MPIAVRNKVESIILAEITKKLLVWRRDDDRVKEAATDAEMPINAAKRVQLSSSHSLGF